MISGDAKVHNGVIQILKRRSYYVRGGSSLEEEVVLELCRRASSRLILSD